VFRYGLRNPESPRPVDVCSRAMRGTTRRECETVKPPRCPGLAVLLSRIAPCGVLARRCRASGPRDRRSLAVISAWCRLPAGVAGSLSACVTGRAPLSRAHGATHRERPGLPRVPRPFSSPGPGRSTGRNGPTGRSLSEHRRSKRWRWASGWEQARHN